MADTKSGAQTGLAGGGLRAEQQIAEQMGQPERAPADGFAAKVDAARGLLRRAALVVDDKDPSCWVVCRGGEPAAPLWLFWPASGAFRTERGAIAGYGAGKLVAAIKGAG